jgi:hypothetical protein
MRLRTAVAAATAVVAASAAPVAAQALDKPTLAGRATLPADATAPAPWPGAPNASPGPAAGATQPVGGFSALVNAGGGTYWAMPDNGFGTKANSASFILRVYRVRPNFKTRRGGTGAVRIEDTVQLRDPGHQVPWRIVTDGSAQRLLTGADFDIESMRVGPRGDLWFGEEFGPFLLHTSASGRLLEPPIEVPYVASPDNPLAPPGFTPNLARSTGFEGMALSTDRRTLYPVLEGPLVGDPDQLRRWIFEYDVRRGRYLAARRQYRVSERGNLVADFTALDPTGSSSSSATTAKAPPRDSRRSSSSNWTAPTQTGSSSSARSSTCSTSTTRSASRCRGRPGDLGLGDPFAMPYVTIESVLPLPNGRLAIVNDTNFGSRGRNPALPDYSDFILVDVPALGGGRLTQWPGARGRRSRAPSPRQESDAGRVPDEFRHARRSMFDTARTEDTCG